MSYKKKMPVLFVGHGSPMNAIGENRAREGWSRLGETIGRPEVIVAVSAHWATRGLRVRTDAENRQIYDMYGFPDELYRVRYSPAGSPEFAANALELLGSGAAADNSWGIDHGVWTVLCSMYPDAGIPVVMVSTDMSAGARAQFETGRKLAALREQGAMILASGNVVHNLGLVNWGMDGGYPWADGFDEAVRDAILAGNFRAPAEYSSIPDAGKAVPTAEHYYPLLAALGAADAGDRVSVWNEYRELGSMSMTSYLFTAGE